MRSPAVGLMALFKEFSALIVVKKNTKIEFLRKGRCDRYTPGSPPPTFQRIEVASLCCSLVTSIVVVSKKNNNNFICQPLVVVVGPNLFWRPRRLATVVSLNRQSFVPSCSSNLLCLRFRHNCSEQSFLAAPSHRS